MSKMALGVPNPAIRGWVTWPSNTQKPLKLRPPGAMPDAFNRAHLDSFVETGPGCLALDRPSGTLSGGEVQRTKMIGHLWSSLTDVTYVLHEPTTGLHPHDIQRMNGHRLRGKGKGNRVLVVEHEPDTIAITDHVVDSAPA